MKRLLLLVSAMLMFSHAYSQRVLEWSIGEPQITCGTTTKICYPLMVSISDGSNIPSLGTSTMRIYYDGNYLSNLTISNIENGYTESGLNQSNPVYGDVFGFSDVKGIFAQFNILDNAAVNPINLSTTPTHVLDFCFDVTANGVAQWNTTNLLCTPLVFDNNHKGWDSGIAADDGYLVNDAGIVGTYFLNSDETDAILADDEVINYLWTEASAFDGRVDAIADKTGATSTTGCLVNACAQADLAITKTDNSASYTPGTAITYTIVASNAGPSIATGATITDAIPSSITNVTWTSKTANGASVTTGGTGTGNSLSSTATIPVGGTVTYTVTGTVSASTTGNLVNTATVTTPSGTTDPNTGNNSSTDTNSQVTNQLTDLSIQKSANKSTSYSLNEVVTYQIVVKNNGPIVATNIRIEDILPAGLTNLSATADKGTWSNSNWNIASLNVGESAVLTLQARVEVEGVTVNTARIVSLDQTDSDLSNNQSSTCISVPVILCQDQSIQVSAPTNYSDVKWFKDGVMVGTGSTLVISSAGTYTITASNSTCPAQGCCPIQVITQVCCPAQICVPVSIRKVR